MPAPGFRIPSSFLLQNVMFRTLHFRVSENDKVLRQLTKKTAVRGASCSLTANRTYRLKTDNSVNDSFSGAISSPKLLCFHFSRALCILCGTLQTSIAAVDRDARSRGKTRQIAGKVQYRTHHFFRRSNTPHGRTIKPFFDRRIARYIQPLGRQRCTGKSRRDRVDANSVPGPFIGKALCQHDYARLG